MGKPALSPLYTVEEVAVYYGVAVSTVWRWVRTKKITAINPGGKEYRFRVKDIEEFNKKNERPRKG